MAMGLVLLAGISIGISISIIIHWRCMVGTLRVDRSEQDEPYMFLELDKGISDILSKKYVLLSVKQENFIPHQ